MKKVLCFAAAALTLFAACQKTTIVYDNDEPQEIAVFAVNKSATKAPVSSVAFPEDYDMMVASYLASGTEDVTEPGDYFDGTLFTADDEGTAWKGNKYWPMSDATLNFLAIAQQPSIDSPYTGDVSEVTFGNNSAVYVKQAVVTFEGNQTSEENYNQFDLMYAAGSQSHTEGGIYSDVPMTFTHALSWIKFTVATTLKNEDADDETFSMTVNSIRLSGANYGGTLTVSTEEALTTGLATSNYSHVWSDQTVAVDDVYVPAAAVTGDDGSTTVSVAAKVEGLSAFDATAKPFGNGLLVVPNDYSEVADGSRPKITVNYTMNQGAGEYTFEKTVEIPTIEWEANKIYTYALNINLTQISVVPSVGEWTSHDNDGNVGTDDDIPVSVDPTN